MSTDRIADDGPDDAGTSLIELIVYFLIASIVILTTAAILINTWTTQRNVTNVTEATNDGQLITSAVERAMRNALAFDVSADGATLVVHTSLTGDLTCQGFSLAAGEARMTMRSGSLGSASTWPLWQTGIAQRGTTPFFAETGATVTYAFDITTTAAPVRFGGQAAARSAATGASAPCW